MKVSKKFLEKPVYALAYFLPENNKPWEGDGMIMMGFKGKNILEIEIDAGKYAADKHLRVERVIQQY